MEPEVYLAGGLVVASSLNIAGCTGKDHRLIRKAVRRVLKDMPWAAASIIENRAIGRAGKEFHWFEFTAAGLELVFARLHNQPGRVNMDSWLGMYRALFERLETRRVITDLRAAGCSFSIGANGGPVLHAPRGAVGSLQVAWLQEHRAVVLALLEDEAAAAAAARQQQIELPLTAPAVALRRRAEIAAAARAEGFGAVEEPDRKAAE